MVSNKTGENGQRRMLPAVIAALLLIGVAAWVSTLLPTTPKVAEPPAVPSFQRILREWNGQVALFEAENTQPTEVYDVTFEALPEEEKERLREGIVIDSEERLAELLDNYTS